MLRNISPQNDMLAESPSWDQKTGRIYWVDIPGKRYHYIEPDGKLVNTVNTVDMVTSLYPDGKGEFLGTMKNSFIQMDPESNNVSIIRHVDLPERVRFNDGKSDQYGNYWAGTMDIEEREKLGKLYVMDNKGNVETLLQDLTISNGLCWNRDSKLFYHIDTPTRRVMVYDYSPGKIAIWNGRVALNFSGEIGNPDGMTIDSQGKLWIAHWGGSCISQWDPDSGKLIRRIKIPAKNVTSCTFGGYEMDQLFITTAKITQPGTDGDQGGSLFVTDESY